MALNIGTASTLHPTPLVSLKNRKHKHQLKFYDGPTPSCLKAAAALSEGAESRVSEEKPNTYPGLSSSAKMQLDLLEKLTSVSSSLDGLEIAGSSSRPTIREQLASLFRGRDDDFSIPLGKNIKKVSAKFLTISQKRNIRRQAYLDEVSQRNDSVFFATIGAFVILPPVIILGVAIATGYVQLFP